MKIRSTAWPSVPVSFLSIKTYIPIAHCSFPQYGVCIQPLALAASLHVHPCNLHTFYRVNYALLNFFNLTQSATQSRTAHCLLLPAHAFHVRSFAVLSINMEGASLRLPSCWSVLLFLFLFLIAPSYHFYLLSELCSSCCSLYSVLPTVFRQCRRGTSQKHKEFCYTHCIFPSVLKRHRNTVPLSSLFFPLSCSVLLLVPSFFL